MLMWLGSMSSEFGVVLEIRFSWLRLGWASRLLGNGNFDPNVNLFRLLLLYRPHDGCSITDPDQHQVLGLL